jgi:prefoldin alpha subunit
MESKDQQKFMEFQLLNQQMQQMQQQLHSLDNQLSELDNIKSDLISLKDQKNSKTFSSLGGGILVESEIKESDSVLLSVGANVLVKKKKEKAIELVEKQLEQLTQIKAQLEGEANKLSLHLASLK